MLQENTFDSVEVCIGESPSSCPFLKNNGDEAPKGPSPIVFQEWTDTRIFSYLKYTLLQTFYIPGLLVVIVVVNWDFFSVHFKISSPLKRGWSGGANVLGKLSVPGRPTNLDNSRARAYCACSRCGWGMFGHFFSRLSFLFSFSLFGRRPDIN